MYIKIAINGLNVSLAGTGAGTGTANIVVFSGFRDKGIEKFLLQHGIITKEHISKKVSVLIVKKKEGSKFDFAIQNNIPVIVFEAQTNQQLLEQIK